MQEWHFGRKWADVDETICQVVHCGMRSLSVAMTRKSSPKWRPTKQHACASPCWLLSRCQGPGLPGDQMAVLSHKSKCQQPTTDASTARVVSVSAAATVARCGGCNRNRDLTLLLCVQQTMCCPQSTWRGTRKAKDNEKRLDVIVNYTANFQGGIWILLVVVVVVDFAYAFLIGGLHQKVSETLFPKLFDVRPIASSSVVTWYYVTSDDIAHYNKAIMAKIWTVDKTEKLIELFALRPMLYDTRRLSIVIEMHAALLAATLRKNWNVPVGAWSATIWNRPIIIMFFGYELTLSDDLWVRTELADILTIWYWTVQIVFATVVDLYCWSLSQGGYKVFLNLNTKAQLYCTHGLYCRFTVVCLLISPLYGPCCLHKTIELNICPTAVTAVGL